MVKEEKEIKRSQEYTERTLLQEQDTELIKLRHKLKMEELEFERATNKLFHEWNLERGRIKRAEDRKDFMERKSFEGSRR